MAQIHQLFARRASYGPDRLKVLGNAFDEAWQTFARNIGEAPGRDRSCANDACQRDPELAVSSYRATPPGKGKHS